MNDLRVFSPSCICESNYRCTGSVLGGPSIIPPDLFDLPTLLQHLGSIDSMSNAAIIVAAILDGKGTESSGDDAIMSSAGAVRMAFQGINVPSVSAICGSSVIVGIPNSDAGKAQYWAAVAKYELASDNLIPDYLQVCYATISVVPGEGYAAVMKTMPGLLCSYHKEGRPVACYTRRSAPLRHLTLP